MRVVTFDRKTGFLKLHGDTASDIWRLSKLILEGDRVGAFTNRRDPDAPSDTPEAQRVRRPVFLSLRAEKVEFHEFTGHLRVTGPIVEGPFDIGRHHTLDIEPGMDVSIVKNEMTGSDWAIIDEGKRSAEDPVLVIACLDWSEGAVVRMHGRSTRVVLEVARRGTGKYVRSGGKRVKEDEEYLNDIMSTLENEAGQARGLVLSGPGFCKEALLSSWKSAVRKGPVPIIVATSEAGLIGVNELLRSGKLEGALAGFTSAEEAKQVERVIGALGREGLGAVGPVEVGKAADAGAVEQLLALDTHLRESTVARAIERVRSEGGHVLIVRHEGEPGKRLAGLGGIAAILRYRLKLS